MFLLLLVILLQSVNIVALDCYKCTNTNSTASCHITGQCKANEKCLTKATGVGDQITYTLGCAQEQDCLHVSITSLPPISIIGRSTSDHVTCSQCCSVDGCNKNLCSSGIPIVNEIGDCKDDPSFDCERVSSIFDVCTDVNHAKTVCRKYCGLCNVIDGSWSFWSNWTSCDVTCESGQMTRIRTCSDPAPAHGGLDCVGNSTQHKLCTLGKCPVDGAWSRWSAWGSCSVTCGVGLQRRDRHCSSPYPDRNGFHCFGDSRDDRGCFERGCSDGQWSTWSGWGACSVSCGSGLRQRTRLCDNPSPSVLGRQCLGNSEKNSICNTQFCPAAQIAFTVSTPSGTLLAGIVPIFTRIHTNIGGGYNQTTGKFTCTLAGLYQFSVTIREDGSSASSNTYCYIRHNGHTGVFASTESGASLYDTGTVSTFLSLFVGDVVDLMCGNWQQVQYREGTVFSGALVRSN